MITKILDVLYTCIFFHIHSLFDSQCERGLREIKAFSAFEGKASSGVTWRIQAVAGSRAFSRFWGRESSPRLCHGGCVWGYPLQDALHLASLFSGEFLVFWVSTVNFLEMLMP